MAKRKRAQPAKAGTPSPPPAAAPTPAPSPLARWLPPLLVVLVVAGVNLNTLGLGFVWDDQWLILDNPRIDDPTYIRYMLFERALWRPVKRISLMADYALWGRSPLGFHLTNLLLQTAVCLSLYFLVVKLGASRRVAALAALFFAVHPVHVEAVANISHRKEPLALLFYLLGFLAYLKARASPPLSPAREDLIYGSLWLAGALGGAALGRAIAAPGFVYPLCLAVGLVGTGILVRGLGRRPSPPGAQAATATAAIPLRSSRFWSYLSLAFLCYLLGFLSKEVGAVMLPSTVAVYELALVREPLRRRLKSLAVFLTPFAAGIVVYGSRGYVFSLLKRFRADEIEWITNGETTSYFRVLLGAIESFGTFVGMLVWPWPLYLDRAFSLPRGALEAGVVLGLGLLVLYGLALAWAARRSPLALFALAWFGLNLLPVLNLIPLTHWWIPERFVYVPSVGFALLLGLGIDAVWRGRLPAVAPPLQRRAGDVALALLLVGHGGLTVWQNTVWRNSLSLWSHTLKYNPRSYRGLYGYGLELDNAGRDEEAEGHYRRAIEVFPSYPEPHYALALLRLNQKRYDDAIREAQVHARLARKDPEPYMIIGNAYFGKGQYLEAAAAYRKAVERKPDHLDARYNLGNALYGAGRIEEALAELQAALRLGAERSLLHLLGNVLEQARRPEAAIEAYRRALQLDPDDTEGLNFLGTALARQQRHEEARVELTRSLRLKPDQPRIRALLESLDREPP